MDRVAVLFDGQNVFHGLKHRYGHGMVHPVLLADHIAANRTRGGRRSEVTRIVWFTGVPDRRRGYGALHARRNRQLALMQETGVVVERRTLRYSEAWTVDRSEGRGSRLGESRQVLARWQDVPREKGIDVALAMEAVRLSVRQAVDVIVIVSDDSDMDGVPHHAATMVAPENPPRFEVAVTRRSKRENFAYVHLIGRDIFEAAKDSLDYSNQLQADASAVVLSRLGVRPRNCIE